MNRVKNDIIGVLDRFLEGKASEKERGFVSRAYNRLLESRKVEHDDLDVDKICQESWDCIALSTFKSKNNGRLNRLRWIYSAAATISLVVAVCLYWSRLENHTIGNRIVADVAPGKRGATLTLSNGQSISLDASASGEIAAEGGVRIVKSSSGQLIYEVVSGKAKNLNPSARNVLSTQRGQTFQVRLPDGSSVWLNAASSIKYPSAFTSNSERVVELDGEAYFEVSHDTQRPFIVKSNHQQVEVLGTHFNVKSYKDEPAVRTTLLEGRVRVSSDRNTESGLILHPGEQASLAKTAIRVSEVNIYEVIAWKNDYFRFVDTPLKEIMNQISRWYDIDVEYKDGVSDVKLNASISRNRNLSQILRMIEKTNEVHFNIERRRIIVSK